MEAAMKGFEQVNSRHFAGEAINNTSYEGETGDSATTKYEEKKKAC